jgi:hypothetical protein
MAPQQSPAEIAAGAIDLFIVYRNKHEYDEETAKAKAVGEFLDSDACECEPHPHWQTMSDAEKDEAIRKAV